MYIILIVVFYLDKQTFEKNRFNSYYVLLVLLICDQLKIIEFENNTLALTGSVF